MIYRTLELRLIVYRGSEREKRTLLRSLIKLRLLAGSRSKEICRWSNKESLKLNISLDKLFYDLNI